MVFIDTMKTILLKTHKQHQSILGANSKEEFPRRRLHLKNHSDQPIKSLEDAASHKKRENQQVCAGKFKFSARRVLALTLFIYLAHSISAFIYVTFIGRHCFFLSSEICRRAPVFCFRIIGLALHTFQPLKNEVGVVEVGSV